MEYTLEELIDITSFQKLQDKLNLIYSFATAIIDNEGKILTAVAWQDICTKFHRLHPECEKECIKSDQYIIAHIHEANPAVSYRCPHGLVDNATPIIIEGKHIANYFIGQFFLEKPDLEFFRKQAKKYGFDEKAYIEAVKRVPIWTKEKLSQHLDFVKEFIDIIAGVGLKNLREIETKEALQKSEEKFRVLTEKSVTGIYIIQDEKMVYVNPSCAKVFGYSPEEIAGKMSPKDLIHPEDFSKVMNKLGERLTGKTEVSPIQYKAIRKDGSVFYIEVYGMSIEYQGRPAVMGTMIDVTEQKLAKEELIFAKERAEESDRLKTAFLHNVSHEIRTPLNAIMGFSELLNSIKHGEDKKTQFVNTIIKSGMQLLNIVDDIMAISTVEAGQEKVREDQVDVCALCKRVYQKFQLKSNENIRFVLNIKDQETTITTDKTKLIQILSNLINNAFKFTEQGLIEFGYTVNTDFIEFYVQDSGIGIPSSMFEEIFKRFRQVEITDYRQYGGAGLGLSISKAYVELMGGKIWLTSILGVGSIFYFTIPHKRDISKAQTERSETISQQVIQKNLTILIVEDEESNYELLKELLSEMEPQFIWAENGLEAVELCKKTPDIHIILMDLKMPVMDGFEATRQIRSIYPNLPILAQSAYSSNVDINEALAAGCNDLIGKPINWKTLLLKINTLVSH
jgi:PAS domain S-box-containing protein